MESRFQRLILASLLVLTCGSAWAQDGSEDEQVLEDIISPDIERREIDEDKIDFELIEIGFLGGVMSIEDFGTSDVYGLRVGLFVTEDVFIEASGGVSELQESSAERLGNFDFINDELRTLTYYNISLGWNIFPGEIYINRWAFHNSFYLSGGAGNTIFNDDEHFTYTFGGGFRLFVTDWVALRMDVRNHVLTHAIFGEEKQIQNLETHLGLTLFF